MVVNLKKLETSVLSIFISIVIITLAVTDHRLYFYLVYIIFFILMVTYYYFKAIVISLNSIYIDSNKKLHSIYKPIAATEEEKRNSEIEAQSLSLFMTR